LAKPSSISRARGFVRLHLFEHLLSDLTDDVGLVASELATNAMVHAQTAFSISLAEFEQTLLLEVEDGSRTGPFRVVAQVLDTGDCGIAIMNLLTRDWGVDSRAGGGKSVWAEFNLEPGDGDKGRVVQQIATSGSTVPKQAEGLLSNLLGDVKEARVGLQTVRAGGSLRTVGAAHAQLVASLTLYIEALGSRRLPVPYLLRDELRLYGRTSAAYNAGRWVG
jgi:anti-sigma regulatory factor (Ser/Thr protein kinase)